MANNYSFKDATASTLTAKSTDTASVHVPHVNVDTIPAITGTVDLGATDNAVLDAIAASVAGATPAGTNNIGDVDVLTLPSIPAGTNNIGDVDILSIAAGDNNIGNVDVVTLPSIPAGTNNIGDVDVLTINGVAPAFGSGARGATVQRVTIATDDSVPVTNANLTTIAGAVSGTEMQVDVLTMPTVTVNAHAVTNAGTFVVQENGAALTALQLIDNAVSGSGFNVSQINGVTPLMGAGATGTGSPRVTAATDSPEVTALQIMDDWDNGASDGASVSGDVAHDTADAGEPVKVGYKAYELDGTAPQTAVAEADRVNAISDLVGRQYVATEHPRFWHVSVDYASAQTNASVRAAPGAGLALYITDILVSNGATAGNITLLDGSGGTVLFELYPGVNGGAVLNLKNPIKLTDNTALCITSTTVTTHSVTVGGFID